MGLSRSTFYDAPAKGIDGDELLRRMQSLCDEFEPYWVSPRWCRATAPGRHC